MKIVIPSLVMLIAMCVTAHGAECRDRRAAQRVAAQDALNDPGTSIETVRVVRFGPNPDAGNDPDHPCVMVSSAVPDLAHADIAALQELGWHRGLHIMRTLAYSEEGPDPDAMNFVGVTVTVGR